MAPLTLVVAATYTNGIGQGSRLPWRLPSEMAYFARVTKAAPPEYANAVIMGRKTWESIPKSRRPLVDRANVVITHNPKYDLCVLPMLPMCFRVLRVTRGSADQIRALCHRLWQSISRLHCLASRRCETVQPQHT